MFMVLLSTVAFLWFQDFLKLLWILWDEKPIKSKVKPNKVSKV